MKNQVIQDRLAALRQRMRVHGIDMYLVFTQDFHGSEFAGGYFGCREYISGFSGSAGTVVITQEEAGLWTDGRYFLQAEQQLSGTGIRLYKMGQEGVPTVLEYVRNHLREGQILGFDGRTASAASGRNYAKICPDMITQCDLIGEIWEDRPPLSAKPAWLLPEKYTGRSRRNKLSWLASEMRKKDAGYMALSSLDEICWLLNIRGSDMDDTPVVLSYLLIQLPGAETEDGAKKQPQTAPKVTLYINKTVLSETDREEIEADGICLAPYNRIYDDIAGLLGGETIWMDPVSVNYELARRVPCGVRLVGTASPILREKAVKNPVELDCIRKAHVKDGVALTRFMYWFKHHLPSAGGLQDTGEGQEQIDLTEIGVSGKLEEFRSMQEGYMGPSFPPISSYGPHGAIVHYSATPESNIPIQGKGFLLMDTGGQYLGGTTDVTRTFVCGQATAEEKYYFTQVLRGHLNLAGAKFPAGCRGYNLDVLARQPLWENGLNYNHGTGHGVGCFLNVHEGPIGIRWAINTQAADRDSCIFEEGMITSDEPGFYLEGRIGIRHENLMVCLQDEKNEYGQFLRFEPLTLTPFDLDGIDPSLMTDREKKLLDQYHQKVYETIGPLLPEEEQEWLRLATRPISA